LLVMTQAVKEVVQIWQWYMLANILAMFVQLVIPEVFHPAIPII